MLRIVRSACCKNALMDAETAEMHLRSFIYILLFAETNISIYIRTHHGITLNLVRTYRFKLTTIAPLILYQTQFQYGHKPSRRIGCYPSGAYPRSTSHSAKALKRRQQANKTVS